MGLMDLTRGSGKCRAFIKFILEVGRVRSLQGDATVVQTLNYQEGPLKSSSSLLSLEANIWCKTVVSTLNHSTRVPLLRREHRVIDLLQAGMG
jgi:hypothetical protein